MNILVCVKRVPDVGSRIDIAPDGKHIETKNLGFTISPHEECAVEEAVQIIERLGGTSTVMTLGPRDAEDQIRESLARGIDNGVLVEGDIGSDPTQTSSALVDAIRGSNKKFDLILFGNESADSGNYQTGIRVASALGLPCVTGVKHLSVEEGTVSARREGPVGMEIYDVKLPAIITVKEGLNLPRHPSLRGTMTARKKPVMHMNPPAVAPGLELKRLEVVVEKKTGAEMLGRGVAAIPGILKILEEVEALNGIGTH